MNSFSLKATIVMKNALSNVPNYLMTAHFPHFLSVSSNPNEHHRQDSSLPVSKERNRFRSITWENYDPLHQKYLEIGESEESFLLFSIPPANQSTFHVFVWMVQTEIFL